ncbi:hypothetical protein P872_08420 [Rhodonellum psychrophilum GCM71 = DSM 17998]|uniref:Tetratricopeptide repeat protein n=2 Tax=Rhodonellum TaxID=336827 RepID=U5BWY8_9BACT|nr:MULTISPECIES: hypothetical protein [Rhodonellum]ERM82084.1 hypothetical protein P872_08420 [Rhodonellum psychrophilum GCM71 = DSM 17998]SDZ17449.1 hypothetical protein SAMN05444412_10730 [Rhodonellum ikkaensis]
MNAQQFLEIIQHSNALHREEISQLLKLHETFPYFQIPKVLLAKYEFDQSGGQEKDFLHWAAVTSPNRLWLQSLVETKTPLEILKKELILKTQEKERISSAKKPLPESEDSLEDGKSLMPDQVPLVNPQERAEALKKLEETLNPNKIQTDIAKEDADERVLSRKIPVGNRDGEELIENLRKKEKKEIIDEKQKAQIDMIKAFSKREFKLASLKEMANFQKQDDLSKTSTQLNNDLISESFALLLVKQGKKQKAKEIYRKLMVKFPEKSVYFTELLNALEDKI